MARGPETRFRSLPPFRTLPAQPISVAHAEKLLTAYLEKAEYTPHLHPDATLNPAGVELSLSSGTEGGITLHNLRRVQAGLRGENLAPEPTEDEKADNATETIAPVQTLEEDAEMADIQEIEDAAAIEQDPLQQANGVEYSDEEPDDDSRYIQPAAMVNGEGKNGVKLSDDSRLDAQIEQRQQSQKRKRAEGAEVNGTSTSEEPARKEKKLKTADTEKESKAERKARKESRQAEKDAKKAAKEAKREAKKAGKEDPGEKVTESAQVPTTAADTTSTDKDDKAARKAEKAATKAAKKAAKEVERAAKRPLTVDERLAALAEGKDLPPPQKSTKKDKKATTESSSKDDKSKKPKKTKVKKEGSTAA